MARADQILRPRNWEEFQHYKDRRPPWIKLHRALLDDREYQQLPLASRALAPMLWLLASESEDGKFNASVEDLIFRLRQPIKDIEAGLKPLIDGGFFTVVHVASNVPADRQHVAVPEESREETETDGGFSSFWSACPKKVAKPKALKAFKTAKVNSELLDIILKDIESRKTGDDWQKDGGKFIPHPASYLNAKRWEDENDVQLPALSGLLAGAI